MRPLTVVPSESWPDTHAPEDTMASSMRAVAMHSSAEYSAVHISLDAASASSE